MATQTLIPVQRGEQAEGVGAQMPFEAIHEQGCYVCNWSGHLLRVPEGSIDQGRWPTITISGNGPLVVTKISNNPFLPLSAARRRAAELDAQVMF